MRSEPRGEDREALEELVARLDPRPRPSPTVRARIRQRFLEEEGLSTSRPGAALRTPNEMTDPLESELSRVPAPGAAPAFRERLRRRFVEGDWNVAEGEVLERGHPGPRMGRRRWWVALAAAAAVVVVALLPREPRWQAELLGDDPVVVGGGRFGPADERPLAELLSRGAVLETGDSALQLALANGLEVRVLPRTTLALDGLPDPSGPAPLVLGLRSGEVYVRTREGVATCPIRIFTELGEVRVRGTVLGVLIEDSGLCVCVARGSVDVLASGSESAVEVRAGERYLVDRGPTPTGERIPLPPSTTPDPHVDPLREFTLP